MSTVEEADDIAVDVAEPETSTSASKPPTTESKRPPAGDGTTSRRTRARMTLRIPDDEVVRPSSPPAAESTPPLPAPPPSPRAESARNIPIPPLATETNGSAYSIPGADADAPKPHISKPPGPSGDTPRPSQPPFAAAAPLPESEEFPESELPETEELPESDDLPDGEELAPPTPRDPSVAPPSPDTVADVGEVADLARTGGYAHQASVVRPAGDTLRGLPTVTPAQAELIVVRSPPAAEATRPDSDEADAEEPPPDSVEPVSVREERVAELPPRPPPRGSLHSIDIPLEGEDLDAAAGPQPHEPAPESAPPLDIDLEKISSRPAPSHHPTPVVAVPPAPPAPKVEASSPPPGPVANKRPPPPPVGDTPKGPAQATPAWLAAARPPAHAIIAADEQPSSAPRQSEPGDAHEVSPEDVVSVESVRAPAPDTPKSPVRSTQVAAAAPGPLLSTRDAARVPPVPATAGPTASVVGDAPPKAAGQALDGTKAQVLPPPIPVVVPSSSPLAPPPMNDAAFARRRVRPWWEELFNDDFIRTMAKISDAQIAAEADFIEDSLGVAKGAMVLDLACGTGRHAIELTRRGYQVVGFDLSLAMLARAADEAQERNQKLNFVQGDMRDMTFEDTFDGVYCWNTSFGFFEEEKNFQIVANVRRALKTGGQFLLDVANRDFLAHQAPSVAWFEGEGCVCMDEMNLDWITSRMRVKRTMMMDDGRTKETEYSIRVYSLHELGKLLHDSGFRVADVSGRTATPGVFLGADSPRTLILAEKRR